MNDDASVHLPLPHISIENGQREVTSFAYVIVVNGYSQRGYNFALYVKVHNNYIFDVSEI